MRTCVVYVWITELVHTSNAVAVNTSLTTFDTATMGVQCFFYLFIGKDIEKLMFIMAIMASVSFIITTFVHVIDISLDAQRLQDVPEVLLVG